jgi:hypothetical protein
MRLAARGDGGGIHGGERKLRWYYSSLPGATYRIRRTVRRQLYSFAFEVKKK